MRIELFPTLKTEMHLFWSRSLTSNAPKSFCINYKTTTSFHRQFSTHLWLTRHHSWKEMVNFRKTLTFASVVFFLVLDVVASFVMVIFCKKMTFYYHFGRHSWCRTMQNFHSYTKRMQMLKWKEIYGLFLLYYSCWMRIKL